MANPTATILQFFDQLQHLAVTCNGRFGVRLQGTLEWQHAVVDALMQQLASDSTVFQLGGMARVGVTPVAFNKGQYLLGRECQWLICDVSEGFDANSFSAALGTLTGGGLLLLIGDQVVSENPAQQWLAAAFAELLQVTPTTLPPVPMSPKVDVAAPEDAFAQQAEAIAQVVRVVEGHRKRPLVLTADRGRGKSSALGIAAAQLMQSRSLNIIVTAPTLANVAPLFQHAARCLPLAQASKGALHYQASQLRFMAPDEIILHQPECDVLLVDEAAALPLPMLMTFVERYHRAVFSTTIHGYEGCGRGFTLKFQQWLQQQRPQMRTLHLDHPIRWSPDDSLEAWHRRAFLLDSDVALLPRDLNLTSLRYQAIPQAELLQQPALLADIFALLVNAHYQTSPNDVLHLLGDDAMCVFVARADERVIGCILAVREGGLDDTLIEQIQRGQRRPKGHLAPVTLANQLGMAVAAQQTCLRIMRIAIHPQLQQRGVGSSLLSHFVASHPSDYYATSFGATSELVRFWQHNQFCAVKIGSQRDQASGCHSLLMIQHHSQPWVEEATAQFPIHLSYELSETLRTLTPALVRQLMSHAKTPVTTTIPLTLLQHYANGGANYESVAAWIEQLLLSLSAEQWLAVSDVLIAKVLQRHTWQECANAFDGSGRKQIEARIRESLAKLLTNLQCKTSQ